MNTTIEPSGTMAMTAQLRLRLLDLARRQEELAANEAAATPYWMPQPATVHGHRNAADALRAEADRLLAAS
ncbi:hypothetical protein F0U44_06165 [Nocardioides humilatus]|uniref:Uncharacterized protein n=1 Tax=Nocardioides humilatus TaxID=2607660 RepID=A0A5B1LQ90_9ACTN|nr:hypothetical protein [Nocardioides humilatus]KAA1421850.1 hypothetical protein F0U44_06165 [Nocardioides humilatus]